MARPSLQAFAQGFGCCNNDILFGRLGTAFRMINPRSAGLSTKIEVYRFAAIIL
jgi:hypothetical protein